MSKFQMERIEGFFLFLFCCVVSNSFSKEIHRYGQHEDQLNVGERRQSRLESIDADMMAKAEEYGMDQMHQLFDVQEELLYSKGVMLDDTDPANFMAVFNWQSEESRQLAKLGYASVQATTMLTKNMTLTKEEIVYSLEKVAMRSNELFPECPLTKKTNINCKKTDLRFRSADGSCNNLDHLDWGSSLRPQLRYLPPAYGDGIQSDRKSVTGQELPAPRHVSSSVHVESDDESRRLTMMVMQWGQFLSHDLSFTPMSRGFNASKIKCCKDGKRIDESLRHPECGEVLISETDPFYSKHRVTCMEFVRSTPSPRLGCSLGPREQINQATSFIDASTVYGSSEKEQRALRTNDSGLLRTMEFGARKPLLPPVDLNTFKGECRTSRPHIQCFAGGDSRVNEVPGLTSMHTLWMREHNRLAKQLAAVNPHWDDERIFQEARKIVGAMNQHITYNEWLPLILGQSVINIFDLRLQPIGFQNNFDASVNPTVANSVAVAAFRFGHSQIRNTMTRCTRDFKELPVSVKLHKELNDPTNMYNPGSIDRILMGLLTKSMIRTDEFMAEEVTNHLFQMPHHDFGLDLAALNIQRGRDHGIPAYNDWRQACGLQSFSAWDDMVSSMSPDSIKRLSSIYESVNDVDLFSGGLSELPVSGGTVGPTFACLLGQQFSNLKKGDRFWYENENHPGRFTADQLMEIRKSSLARVLCDNLDSIHKVQPYVFVSFEEDQNDPLPCGGSLIPSINIEKWRENVEDNSWMHAENFDPEEIENFLEKISDQITSKFSYILHASFERESRMENFSKELPRPLSPNLFYEFYQDKKKSKYHV